MPLHVRDLEEDEFALLATVDRSERIEEQYQVRDGTLHIVPRVIDVAGWYPDEIVEYEARLHAGEGHERCTSPPPPTRGTVDAYRRVGAVLAAPPDPHLVSIEPEDIHLVLAI